MLETTKLFIFVENGSIFKSKDKQDSRSVSLNPERHLF